MDDCSPDNTAEVASSFHDPRIKHIRNEQNLGHLRNYNKGISMSRGKYVWLISADDYLRRPYVLQRSVELMERHPRVGYVFCPGVGVRNGQETEVLDFSVYAKGDRIVNGGTFLKTLLDRNVVVSASAMVRRECYETISLFPLDASWAGARIEFEWNGDWYLWCMFALVFDVGYLAEPMVCYREHDLSMTTVLTRENNVDSCSAADIGMLWLIRHKANERGMSTVSKACLHAVAREYARHGASKRYRHSMSSMSIDQFEGSLCRSTENERERKWVRARFLEGLADGLYWRGDLSSARRFYRLSLQNDSWMLAAYAKLLLLWLGTPGDYLRRARNSTRRTATNSLPDAS
jgi:glycosyltransferase involved in cell wall biosynthesis